MDQGDERKQRVDNYKNKIAGSTEEEVYQVLGLEWIPPEMRENRGEIELAKKQVYIQLSVFLFELVSELWIHTLMIIGNVGIYDRIIETGNNLFKAWYNRGISLAHLGNYKEAIKSYDNALELNPNDAKTIYEKAISLNNLGKHKDAERLVSKARDMGLNV